MSQLPFPMNQLDLVGRTITRGVTLPLPAETVARLLPPGLALAEQKLTPEGTHPVMLLYNDMLNVRYQVPLIPVLDYHEMVVGIPYVFVDRGGMLYAYGGPFFYMPVLYLDNLLGVIGGRLYYGYPKKLARISLRGSDYRVDSLGGKTLTSLTHHPAGQWRRVTEAADFDPLREALTQPLVMQIPLGSGPCYACNNYDKEWETATVRPIRTVARVDRSFVSGLPCGRFPESGESPGFDESPIGAFEFDALFRGSMLYPCSWNRLEPIAAKWDSMRPGSGMPAA